MKKSIHLIEDEIQPGDIVVFRNGKKLTISKYNKNKHMITFTNGEIRDLYVIYDDYVKEIIHPQITKKDIEDFLKNFSNIDFEEEKPAQIKKDKKKSFSLYAIAGGKPGKKFTIKQFLDITKSFKKPGGANTSKSIELNDEYTYEADSQQEITVIKKINSYTSYKRLRGQCLGIPYRYAGKDHIYYPDLVLLTNTNKIIVIEVKELVQMFSEVNIRKYEALQKYCKNHGYLYIMCNKKFITPEIAKTKPILRSVENEIERCLETKKSFDFNDYKDLIEGKDKKYIKKVRDSIGRYLASHPTLKMKGDLTFKCNDFKIIKRKAFR